MKKKTLESRVAERTDKEGRILKLIFDNLNKGQTKKVLQNDEVAAEVERLGIEVKK